MAFVHRKTRCLRRPAKKIGIYAAYYNSSAFFEAHLECIKKNTTNPYDYYVMKNFSHHGESVKFDEIAARYPFAKVFKGAPGPFPCPLRHGESLQRMISQTDNEIIILCDIDTLLIGAAWDEMVLRELESKEMVAVIAYFDNRKGGSYLPLVAHPSFMAFRRTLLEENGLDLYDGEGNDPAYKLTRHYIKRGCFNEKTIKPLLPTRVDYPNGYFQEGGAFGIPRQPSHGFCSTYGDLIFHFWHSMNYADKKDIIADNGSVLVAHDIVRQKVEYYTRRYSK